MIFLIRHLMIEDAPAVHALNMMTEMGSADLETTALTLTRILHHPDQYTLFVFEADGYVIGYIHAQIYEMLYSPNTVFNVIALAIDERIKVKESINSYFTQLSKKRWCLVWTASGLIQATIVNKPMLFMKN